MVEETGLLVLTVSDSLGDFAVSLTGSLPCSFFFCVSYKQLGLEV